MSKIALTPNASGTGTLTVAAPNTNTDRTLTLPDVTTTLVGTDATQTLTNKTLSNAIISDQLVGLASNAGAVGVFGGSNYLNGAGMVVYGSSHATRANEVAFTNGAYVERMRIDATGNVSITQAPGKYTVDVSGGATAIANGGTVDFANASGMLVVNNHNSGAVTIYLCGGGGATAIGTTGTQVGTFTYVAGIGGYRWTNNFGSTANVGFFFVRTRTTA